MAIHMISTGLHFSGIDSARTDVDPRVRCAWLELCSQLAFNLDVSWRLPAGIPRNLERSHDRQLLGH